MRGQRKDQTNL